MGRFAARQDRESDDAGTQHVAPIQPIAEPIAANRH